MGTSHSFGSLLREYRNRVSPADLGLLPATGQRRTPGLRREELAELSRVSADYIKRLEQGRSRPSASVINALARVLRLSQAEYEQLCALTGHTIVQPGERPHTVDAPTRQLLERFDMPTAIYDAGWTLLAYNTPGIRLFGDPAPYGSHGSNMAWRFFMEPANFVWESDAQARQFKTSLVADLREAADRYPYDENLAKLVAELCTTHRFFDDLWSSASATKLGGTRGITHHPAVGSIELDANMLAVPNGDLRIVVFTAEPGTRAAHRLSALTDDHHRGLHYPQ
ncbi:MAG: transcriptional regulator [Nocardia sp.]|uniref:helix-turn-helix domain-containing protein n=1 Tax=Nocardia sp. TaxID=1821 RepID=UPI002608F268|nr:helix-turn-helix transcriptional regulator [Nocardia sp.]MCU1647318.1 transcriptional regulator [Nocardia sp.]